jgi:hypothetical protein
LKLGDGFVKGRYRRSVKGALLATKPFSEIFGFVEPPFCSLEPDAPEKICKGFHGVPIPSLT